jgi:hypothetical protein
MNCHALGLGSAVLAMFPNRVALGVARIVTLVLGLFIGVMTMLKLLDTSLLLNISVFGHSLFFYTVFLAPLFLVCKHYVEQEKQAPSLMTEDDCRALHDLLMSRFSSLANFVDASPTVAVMTTPTMSRSQWQLLQSSRGLLHSACRSKTEILLQELVSVVLSGFFLFFWLPRQAELIWEFMRQEGVLDVDVDWVCRASASGRTPGMSVMYGAINDRPAFQPHASAKDDEEDRGPVVVASVRI